jgi:Phosphoesterase family
MDALPITTSGISWGALAGSRQDTHGAIQEPLATQRARHSEEPQGREHAERQIGRESGVASGSHRAGLVGCAAADRMRRRSDAGEPLFRSPARQMGASRRHRDRRLLQPSKSVAACRPGLCDQWSAEVPGPTMPNRLYIHAASSRGWARNDWSVPLSSVTIYEQLQKNKRTWAVYFSDQNEVAQYRRINTQRGSFKLYESASAAGRAPGRSAGRGGLRGAARRTAVDAESLPRDLR